ncbi:MAG: MarR family transcriptional regulator [Epulopiscium sp.]|nr:MarR family transcriptional regulator [Candidatus Epulonipiscium sp.]
MKNNKAHEVSHQFLEFIMNLTQWLHENYFKEFNINGKGENSITDRQFTILVLVNQFGLCTISELGRELNLSSSCLSIVASKLVKEGYLKRQHPSEEEDRRKTYLSLTEKGRGVLVEVYKRIMLVFGEFYSSLKEDKQEDFEEGLKKLSEIFDSQIHQKIRRVYDEN